MNSRPRMKENYINMDELARQIDQMTREQVDDFAQHFDVLAERANQNLDSAYAKRDAGQALNDEEAAVLVDYLSTKATYAQGQEDAVAMVNQQRINRVIDDRMREEAIVAPAPKREYAEGF